MHESKRLFSAEDTLPTPATRIDARERRKSKRKDIKEEKDWRNSGGF
jgi:hypothetical protein